MARYRDALPQLDGSFFLADGGIETTLIFNEGIALPDFAAFTLLKNRDGVAALDRYFRTYAELARRLGVGLILESATWRASADWGRRLGYSGAEVDGANRKAIGLIEALRDEYETAKTRLVISGCIGPRGDGYDPGAKMSAAAAQAYHGEQIGTFAATAADMVSAITMNYVEEAIGIAEAARLASMPVVISYTVETDGKLPTGQPVDDAISEVDLRTSNYPLYYMINCAHPSHFSDTLASAESRQRIRGIRANASRKSHAELNDSAEVDSGDPDELAADYLQLKKRLPELNVMGGCCGTDERHIERIALKCAPLFK